MVHALKELWRVLAPNGVLIDLRPTCMDVDLLIQTDQGWEAAGRVDRGELRLHDNAANLAMRKVVDEHFFKKIKLTYFNTRHYWNDLEGLRTDASGCWKEDVTIAEETWQRARLLLGNRGGEDRVCIPVKRKISSYLKITP